LEQTHAVGRLDEFEGQPVVQIDVIGIVEIEDPPGGTTDLRDRVRHDDVRGLLLHPLVDQYVVMVMGGVAVLPGLASHQRIDRAPPAAKG
jgi:hypothetical protein